MRAALQRLSSDEREVLVAHEVSGQDTRSLADGLGSTAGAVAAQLNRTRAKLRVEYLLELHGEPPTTRCRPVLLSLSAGDRRRQAAVDAGYHLLDCGFCAALSAPLFDRQPREADVTVVPVRVDADIVTVRKRGRDVALQVGFSETEATVIATAISEIARNIVRFTSRRRGLDRARLRRRPPWRDDRRPGRRARDRRHRPGDDRRLHHVRRARSGPTWLAAADGRVRDQFRDRPRDHRYHDQVASGRDGRSDHRQPERTWSMMTETSHNTLRVARR